MNRPLLSCFTGTLGVVRHDLNLDPHPWRPQLMRTRFSPDGFVVWHILAEVFRHGRRHFRRDLGVVRVDAVDLRPAFAAHRLKGRLDVLKGLADLLLDALVELRMRRKRVPAT